MSGLLFSPWESAAQDKNRMSYDRKTVLFLGDSITAGYGLDPSEAYPSLIQQKIDALGWPFRVANAGLSGDTTAAGTSRLKWLLRSNIDVMVLALGANDGLRGLPPESTRKNLQEIIDTAKKTRPGIAIILCGMKMPPNYGEAYTARYAEVFPELARKNQLPFVPFLLQDVGGKPEFNLPDRIHPNAEGHKIIAETLWTALKPVLQSRLDGPIRRP